MSPKGSSIVLDCRRHVWDSFPPFVQLGSSCLSALRQFSSVSVCYSVFGLYTFEEFIVFFSNKTVLRQKCGCVSYKWCNWSPNWS